MEQSQSNSPKHGTSLLTSPRMIPLWHPALSFQPQLYQCTHPSSGTSPSIFWNVPVYPLERTCLSSGTSPSFLWNVPTHPLERTLLSSGMYRSILWNILIYPLERTHVSSGTYPCILWNVPVCPLGSDLWMMTMEMMMSRTAMVTLVLVEF